MRPLAFAALVWLVAGCGGSAQPAVSPLVAASALPTALASPVTATAATQATTTPGIARAAPTGTPGTATAAPIATPLPAPTLRLPCDAPNDDVFGDILFSTRHPIGARPYGCVVVSAADGHPVFDGTRSARFEVRPDDCSGNSGFDDCANDRSRHEIGERLQPSEGRVIRYETRVFIPSQQPFKPSGGNILFLSQINYSEPGVFGIVAYLEVGPNDQLMVRTHVGLTTTTHKQYPVATQIFDRWIQVDYEIRSTAKEDGYIRVLVDGVLAVDEARQTLPSPRASTFLTLGIYNAFKARASEPFGTQVVYFDGVRKLVR